MTIRTTLTEIYPDGQFMGTRQLGTKYVLSRGMRGYFVSNSHASYQMGHVGPTRTAHQRQMGPPVRTGERALTKNIQQIG